VCAPRSVGIHAGKARVDGPSSCVEYPHGTFPQREPVMNYPEAPPPNNLWNVMCLSATTEALLQLRSNALYFAVKDEDANLYQAYITRIEEELQLRGIARKRWNVPDEEKAERPSRGLST